MSAHAPLDQLPLFPIADASGPHPRRGRVIRSGGGWEIIDMTEADGTPLPPMGSYRTKAEAESDRRGLWRSLRFWNRRGFVTVDCLTRKRGRNNGTV